MRLRNVKNKEEILANSSYVILDGNKYYGKWCELFGNNNPIYIEIGMGKGKFIIENSLRYPNINFIGIEKYDSVLAKAVTKIDGDIPNLRLLRLDALNIDQVFYKEVSRIYLNFSDPWPKKRHHLRRLSSRVFLEKYEDIFVDKDEIYMRTDNRDLYIYSLESFSKYGYKLNNISFDLHSSEDDLVTTEYEDKFVSIGNPIYSVVAIKDKS